MATVPQFGPAIVRTRGREGSGPSLWIGLYCVCGLLLVGVRVERIAYLNGSFVKESEATISVFDRGFIHGDAAFDALRTFRHVPFRVNDYLDRFFRSLRYMQIRSPLSREEWQGVIAELIERNLPMMGEDDDSTIML